MELLFWGSVAFVAYVYAGYPALLAMWARGASLVTPSRIGDDPSRACEWPGVTIIVAVRDEAHRLRTRIENLLASDYPSERLEIIVASDGSIDEPERALAPFGDRVTLLLLPPSGKAGALNAAVREATHPILVFADARQRFATDAIRRLVSHFEDPRIGAVSGELILDCEEAIGARSTIGDGVGAYWRYEKWLRRQEAIVASTLGVTGAIYAMRRWLWRPLPADTILDDVAVPMRVVLGGHRVIVDDRAYAYDETACDASSELRRKSRTLAGNFQLLAREPRLLVPVINPVWLQFMSHKVARLIVPYALVAAFVSSAALAATSAWYAAAFAAQLALLALAAYGAVLDRRGRRVAAIRNEVFRDAA